MQESIVDRILDHLHEEWGVVTEAPGLTALLAVIVGAATWLYAKHYFRGKMDALEANLTFHKDMLEHSLPPPEIAPREKKIVFSRPVENIFPSNGDSSTKLKISLDENHPFDANVNGAFFWRVDIFSVSSEPVMECSAYLTKIVRNGVEKWGGKKAALTFEPGSLASTCKTINPGVKEILDVVITHGDSVIPATWPRGSWPYHEQLHTIFEYKGDYVLIIVIEAKNITACPFQYKFSKEGQLIENVSIVPMPLS